MKKLRSFAVLHCVLLALLLVGCKTADTGKVEQIQQRGTLLVGSTGDYRPLSFLEPATQQYWGFDVEMAEIIARDLGVEVRFVPTSWPTLTDDMLNDTLFDLALCGISITAARQEIMLMSEGYLRNGKTFLCRKEDEARFQSLDDLNQPDVVVMVNPGGLNEQFAREHLTNAHIVVHPHNEEIPTLVAEGEADVMITEIVEAPYYVQHDPRLSAPLLTTPFTNGLIGALMRKGDVDLLERVNSIINRCKQDGTLQRLHEKYGFNYGF
ncbi:MAG: transporter substrate-binding domain-containing protein [Bacteroidales bacterium]|nr:transporter substrate-binding domain-containing protein [Bacteroidales bacterium]